jgi:hypothetical protein
MQRRNSGYRHTNNNIQEETTMSLQKILGWIAILIAVVGAFATIPHAAAVLVVLGLVGGVFIEADANVRVIVSALALTALGGTLGSIPAVGSYLVTIVGGLATFVSGAALSLILKNIYKRFKP